MKYLFGERLEQMDSIDEGKVYTKYQPHSVNHSQNIMYNPIQAGGGGGGGHFDHNFLKHYRFYSKHTWKLKLYDF